MTSGLVWHKTLAYSRNEVKAEHPVTETGEPTRHLGCFSPKSNTHVQNHSTLQELIKCILFCWAAILIIQCQSREIVKLTMSFLYEEKLINTLSVKLNTCLSAPSRNVSYPARVGVDWQQSEVVWGNLPQQTASPPAKPFPNTSQQSCHTEEGGPQCKLVSLCKNSWHYVDFC